jgi:hypothetical protein
MYKQGIHALYALITLGQTDGTDFAAVLEQPSSFALNSTFVQLADASK